MNRFESNREDSESSYSFSEWGSGEEPEKKTGGGEPESYSAPVKKEWRSEWEQLQSKKRRRIKRKTVDESPRTVEKTSGRDKKPLFANVLRNIFIAVALFSFLVSSLLPLVFDWMGGYLVVSDDLTLPADFICVCGGGSTERVAYAAMLYSRKKAAAVLVLGDSVHLPGISATWSELAVRELTGRYNVPRSAIISDSRATSTFEEAVLARKLFERKDADSAIVVSEPFHTRRVKMIFDHVFTDSGIDLRYSATDPSWFDPDGWWQDEKMIIAVFDEYVKTLLYVYWYIFPGVREEAGA